MKKLLLILGFALGLLDASTIMVDTYLDDNSTIGQCSLRSAILAANTDAVVEGCVAGDSGIDTIKLKKGDYAVSSDLPQITDSLVIEGEGKDITVLQARIQYGGYYWDNVAAHFFYFRPAILSGKTFILKGMTLEDGTVRSGTSGGGCVKIDGSHQVTLEHVKLFNCSSFTGATTGGGLLFNTRSSITNVIAEFNLLWSEIGWSNHGLMDRTNGTFYAGGGLFLNDIIHFNMVNSVLLYNTGKNGGGMKISVGNNPNDLVSEINILRSKIEYNKAFPRNTTNIEARGGAIYIDGSEGNLGDNIINVSIRHSTIKDNAAFTDNGEGAGIYLKGSNISVTLENTEFFRNMAGTYATYNPIYAYDYYLGFNEGLTDGFNIIGAGANLGGTSWSLIADPTDPTVRNSNKDFTHITTYSFSGFSQGYCPNEPYDFRGYGLNAGSSIRIVGNPSGVSDGCDIGAIEYNAVPVVDYDGDGVLDEYDAFPLNASESVDTDNDNTGDNEDTDDDNDGVLDVNDAFPLDSSESLDTDGDGIGNNADIDDDNDNVLDINDAFPLDATESVDTDSDGTGNNADYDDDNDGISDIYEISLGFNPLDANSTPLDTDSDGTPDALDSDDDNDGISDSDEVTLGFDPLNAADGLGDYDSDGFSNALEFSIGTNMNNATDTPIWTPILMDTIMTFVPTKVL